MKAGYATGVTVNGLKVKDKHTPGLVIEQKHTHKRTGFSAFLCRGKIKLGMEKSLSFIAQFCVNPVERLVV